MALIFMDGFDCYADLEEARRGGWAKESDLASKFTTTGGVNGGGALDVQTTAAAGWFHYVPAVALGATRIVSFWFKIDLPPGSTDDWFMWRAEDNVAFYLTIDENGDIGARPTGGAETAVTVTSPITTATWHYLEIKVVFGTGTTDGSYDIRVDENSVLSESGIDTNDSDRLLNNFCFRPGDTAGSALYDDVIVMDALGGTFDDFQGKLYIETLNVDSDGGTVAWTRNTGASDYLAVDDTANAADDDTTYVDSSTATEETRFGIPEPTDSDDPIKAVQIRAKLTKTDAGTRTVRGLMNINGGGEEILFDEIGVAEGWGWYSLGIRATNDTGGSPWDATNVGLTEIGLEVVV
jgi:hypothetical protein